ncbi:MAG: DUF1836 domain-containing protein [Lachnospiraceae bacterium]|nr:DUF1836 domain-containing protein [Lachnospiraceae bacterium]
MEYSEEFEQLLEKYSHIPYIRPAMLPEINLYMDQVTTFMEEHLKSLRRNPEDKILTKTMINNYTKNRLLPPPEKKKYSQEHLLLLIYIYYLKSILSIGDISTLLAPMTERYWEAEDGDRTMRSIYRRLLSLEKEMFRDYQTDIRKKMDLASDFFGKEEMTDDERDYLQNLALVCELAFDVYLKKQMMETIIDDMKHKKGEKPSEG